MFLKFIHFFWLSNLLLCNCSEYSLIIPCISVVSVVMSPLSFFYLSLLSFSLSLALEFFSILLIFSLKNQFLFFSILYHFSCLYFTYLCSDFFDSFFLLCLNFICSFLILICYRITFVDSLWLSTWTIMSFYQFSIKGYNSGTAR